MSVNINDSVQIALGYTQTLLSEPPKKVKIRVETLEKLRKIMEQIGEDLTSSNASRLYEHSDKTFAHYSQPSEFIMACYKGYSSLARKLCNVRGLKISELVAKNGYTPMHFAAHHGDLEFMKYLEKKGVPCDQPSTDEYAWTPLDEARIRKHEKCAQFLLEKGADLDKNIE